MVTPKCCAIQPFSSGVGASRSTQTGCTCASPTKLSISSWNSRPLASVKTFSMDSPAKRLRAAQSGLGENGWARDRLTPGQGFAHRGEPAGVDGHRGGGTSKSELRRVGKTKIIASETSRISAKKDQFTPQGEARRHPLVTLAEDVHTGFNDPASTPPPACRLLLVPPHLRLSHPLRKEYP